MTHHPDHPVALRDGGDVVIWLENDNGDWQAYRIDIRLALNFARRLATLAEGENLREYKRGA